MSLILIAGTSTAGKSTVTKVLTKRGYEAYDTEHNGISAWYNKKSGKRVAGFGAMPERTEGWLRQHHWLISFEWLNDIAYKAKHKLIFLCGSGDNEFEVRKLCDKVVWLKTDEQTIRKRVTIPRDHDYGTRPHELTKAIKDNIRKEDEYKKDGAIMIDATQSIDKIVADILALVSKDI